MKFSQLKEELNVPFKRIGELMQFFKRPFGMVWRIGTETESVFPYSVQPTIPSAAPLKLSLRHQSIGFMSLSSHYSILTHRHSIIFVIYICHFEV